MAQGSKDAQAAMDELKEKLEADKQAALEKLRAEHEAAIAKLVAAHGDLEQQKEALRMEHEVRVAELKAMSATEKKAAEKFLEAAAAAKLKKAQDEAAKQREEMEEMHRKELEAKDGEHQKAAAAAQAAAEKAMDEERDRAATKLSGEMERMAAERKASEEELDSKHAAATEQAGAAHAQVVAVLEGRLDDANEKIRALEKNVEGLQHEIASLRDDVKQRDSELVQEKERAAAELKDVQGALKQEKKRELDAMLEEHLEETKGLHEEFTQASAQLSALSMCARACARPSVRVHVPGSGLS